MNIEIEEYHQNFDSELLRIFYKSTYHQRKEFEYFRYPPRWIRRYLDEESIVRIARVDGKIVASLGLILYDGFVNGKIKRIGFFVDNCIDPDFSHHYFEIFDKLFEKIENEAKKKNVAVVFGWEFVHRAKTHYKIYKKRHFKRIEGFYWYPTGSDLRIHLGSMGENKLNVVWRFLLRLKRVTINLKERKYMPQGFEIKRVRKKDLQQIATFLNEKNKNIQLATVYSKEHLEKVFNEKLSHGLAVWHKNRIEGALLFFVGAWSGWMFGKPHYDKKHSHFFAYTPFEFTLRDERKTGLGASMLFELMKQEDVFIKKNGYTLTVDCFFEKQAWREKSVFDVGGEKAAYDFGCLLIKNLSKQKIHYNRIISLPTLFVIAPVPKNHLSS